MNLNAYLSTLVENERAPDRRKKISTDELEARLKIYEERTPGFEATSEHLVAMRAIFDEHRHTFITGGAGVGKTTFISAVVIQELDFRNLHWSVVATTGIAGSHLNGKTLHSFFGIGLGPNWVDVYPRAIVDYLTNAEPGSDAPRPADMSAQELDAWYEMFYEQWLKDPRIKDYMRQGVLSRLRSHEVLIVDEVSMLHGAAMLGYLDYMLKQVRGDQRPFGGLQMVFVGDFAQLPPVEEGFNDEKPDWAFLSHAWNAANVKSVELTKVFRQGDTRFVEFLNHIRIGVVTAEDREYASQFVRNNLTVQEACSYTFLVPVNEMARKLNANALEQYPGPTIPLTAEFCIAPGVQRLKDWEVRNQDGVQSELMKSLRRRLLDQVVSVRIGYPVMFTMNDPSGRFVNGTRGYVRAVNINPRTQEFGWEDTDHVIVGIPGKKPEDPEVQVLLYRWSYSRNREQDATEMTDVPAEWNAKPENPKLPARISVYPTVRQFPLIPACAITIHKSQGMSLSSAILALSRAFASGHVYVGLSRLRSPEGLILAEPDFRVKVDPYVMEFYRSIREKNN